MRRGTIVLILFVLVVAGVIGVNVLLRNQPPIQITVAVDPLIADWARQAVDAFHTSPSQGGGRRVQVTLTVQNDAAVWRNRIWSEADRPDAWIPASNAAVIYAQAVGVPLEIVQESLALSPLVIGGYTTRVNAITQGDTVGFDWAQIGQAAIQENWQVIGGERAWQFFKLAFPLPTQTSAGLGVLLSASADYHSSATLDTTMLSERAFRDGFLSAIVNSVPNFTSIGPDVPAFMAQGGATVADFGIAPESLWLLRLGSFSSSDPIVLQYPRYLFVLDFPLVRWVSSGTNVDSEIQSAVERFGVFLTDATRQNDLLAFGLRPPVDNGAVPPTASLFNTDPVIPPDLSAFTRVEVPPRNTDAQSLLTWFENARR